MPDHVLDTEQCRTAHHRATETTQTRRGVLAAAGTALIGTTVSVPTVTATDQTTIEADIAADELDLGEETTVTFSVDGAPEGSQGVSIDIGVDQGVAAITDVTLGEHAPQGLEDRIAEDIEDAGGAVASIDAQSFDPDGIDATAYELATFQVEASGAGTTPIDLLDVTVNDPDGQNPDVSYDTPSLVVTDGEDDSPGADDPGDDDTGTDDDATGADDGAEGSDDSTDADDDAGASDDATTTADDDDETDDASTAAPDTEDDSTAASADGTETDDDSPATGEDDSAAATGDESEGADVDTGDDSIPGFGVGSAAVGLLAAAGVLRQRNEKAN